MLGLSIICDETMSLDETLYSYLEVGAPLTAGCENWSTFGLC